MGWTKQTELAVDRDHWKQHCNKAPELWSRNGNAVVVVDGYGGILIPKEIMLSVVAEELRSNAMSKLEEMTDEELVGSMLLNLKALS